MHRLLVVGAGATIEECRRSGHRPDDPDFQFPTIRNFARKLFDPTSEPILRVTASYLQTHRIEFDPKLLEIQVGDSFTPEDMAKSPIGVFLELEAQDPARHNVERLFEHAWRGLEARKPIWGGFIHDAVYLKLFAIFTEQFGLGAGVPMHAGRAVAAVLRPGDVVLNLNYDIAFDLALKQAGREVRYAPETHPDAITVLKPHGSFNFYVNHESGRCFFEEPDRIRGSVGFPDPQGGTYFPQYGIVPPRLNKSYEQLPGVASILDTGRPFEPRILMFWGVGLTDSDVDLLSVYRQAAAAADQIDFVNPSKEAFQTARKLIRRNIDHFPTLDRLLAAYGASS